MDLKTSIKNNKKAKILIIAAAVFIVLIIGAILFYNNGISAVSESSKEVTVQVEKGSSSYQVIDALSEAGLVKSNLCGKIYIKFNAPDNLQANTYVLNQNMSLSEMIDIISKGTAEYVLKTDITVIEGSTIPQVAEEIAKDTGLSEKEILAKWADEDYLKKLIDEYWFLDEIILNKDIKYPLEGYFYPETYFVTDDKENLEAITEQMLDMMDIKLSEIKYDINDLDLSVHEFLTFASIVESESLFEEDRAKIAGVFWNRLNEDMKLQSDSTVLYALGEKYIDVTIKDTQVDSKYNTYQYEGIPVGPVCTVQADTMEDCINYEKSDYLYFFATKDGTVIYSKTYKEHQKAVEENDWY